MSFKMQNSYVKVTIGAHRWHTVKMSEGGRECPCDYCQKRSKAMCAHGTAVEMHILYGLFRMTPGGEKAVTDYSIQIQYPQGPHRGDNI